MGEGGATATNLVAQPEGCWLHKQRCACCATKTGGVVPLVNTKIWYNVRCFMGEKTQENSQMGYSAAYPTRAERCLEVKDSFFRSVKAKTVL